MLALAAAVLVGSMQAADIPVLWTGGDSRIARHEVALITNERTWIETWLKNKGREDLLREMPPSGYGHYNRGGVPEVNFQSHVVLAMFDSPKQVAGYTILGTKREAETCILRFVPRYYSIATSGKPEDIKRMQQTPYAFVLIPRGFSKLQLEEGIIERKDKPIEKFRVVKTLTIRD